MGNRAVITFSPKNSVYIHWNGGRCSIEGFLDAVQDLQLPRSTPAEAADSFARVAKAFVGDSTVMVGQVKNLDCDNGDNGQYFINSDLKITRRRYRYAEEEINEAKRQAVREESVKKYLTP